MLRYIIGRTAQMIVVLLAISLIVFGILNFTGDPVLLLVPADATQAQIDQARAKLGLDKPLWQQYIIFAKNAIKGDFGRSYIFKRPALELILERLPATLEITVFAAILAGIIAIPLGVYSGAKPESFFSKIIMSGSILGISLPSFWLGIMMILVFSVNGGILPSSGRGKTMEVLGLSLSIFTWDGFLHIIMPSLTLAVGITAMLIRLTRSGIMEVMGQDYIKFAKAKGLPYREVLFKHALKNALIPVITIYGMQFGNLIAFATITETIYAWPGMGKLLIDSINMVDRPVILAYLLLVGVMFVLINFVVDIIYTLIDPRIELR